jgi:hypothetical protein
LKNTTKIVCPKCNAVTRLSLIDTDYIGPRKCWKCHEYFTITIENNRVTSCEPLSQEEYERRYPTKAAAGRAQLIFDLSPGQKETDITPAAPEKTRVYPESVISQEPPGRSGTGKPILFPPDRLQTFIPLEETDEKPGKPLRSKNHPKRQVGYPESGDLFPPDRFQTFVPLEDTDKKPGKSPKSKSPPEKQHDNNSPGTIYPPDRFRTFVPLEDTDEKPGKR